MKRISLLALSLIILLQGCGRREDPTPQNYQLKLDPATLVLSAAGEAQTVQVTTDAPSWKAEASADWIKVSTSGNTISVSAEANPDKDSRSGAVRVTAGETRAEVSVLQGGKSNRPADDPYPMASYGLDDESIFVKKEYSEGIIAANPEQNTFTVPSSAVGAQKPEVGQKLIMNTPTDLFPNGLLAKVVSVNEAGSNYEVKYEPIKLEEAFSDLNIPEQAIDLGSYVKEIIDANGNKVNFSATKAANNETYTVELPAASWPLNLAGLEIAPAFKMDLTMLFQAIVADYKLYSFNFDTKIDLNIGATIACGYEGSAVDEKIPICKIICGAIPVPPILITPAISLDALLEVSGKVSVEATVSYTTSKRYGIHYDANTGWSKNDYSEANKNSTLKVENVSPKVEGSFAYGYSIGPEVGIYVQAVTAGIGYDSKTKHTLSGSYDLLHGNADDYMNWTLVQHLQNAEYSVADLEAIAFHATVLTKDVYEVGTPDVTRSEQKWKVLPKLGAFPEFERVEDGMNLTVWVKNRNLLNGQLKALVAETPTDLQHLQTLTFPDSYSLIESLNAEKDAPDSVALKGFLHLEEDDPDLNYADFIYEVPGVGRFNLGSYMQEFDDEQSRAALLAILKDLYQSKASGGAWEGCNWFDKDVSVYALKNVRVSRRGDQFFFKINIPADWKLGPSVTVNDRSKGCTKFGGWELIFDDASVKETFGLHIFDSHFTGYYATRSANHFEELTINSPIWTRLDDLGSDSHTFKRLDLSYTPLEKLELEYSKLSVREALILKNCPKLKQLSFDMLIPKAYDVTGCSALEEIKFELAMIPEGYFNAATGTESATLLMTGCTAEGKFSIPSGFKELYFEKGTFGKFEVVGNKSLTYINLKTSKGESVVVKNCAKMGTISCPDTGISEFEVADLPEMSYISVEDNPNLKRLVPEVFDQIRETGGSVDYDIRYSYEDTGTGTIEYEDNGYGFWYEGEPECGYHGKEPPEAPNYDTNPNDTMAQANFRKILKDLYECRDGSWDGCNWGDVSVPIKDMVNVKWYSGSTGGNPYEDIEITIPAEWALLPDVIVYRHFGMEGVNEGYGTIGHSDYWFLRIEGERKFKSFQINDTRLAQIFVRGEADLFAMHSPYFSFDFSNGVVRKDYLEIPAKIKTLNLTGCDYTRIFYKTDAEHMPEKIILDLPYFSWEGSQFVFECTDSTPCKVPTIEVKNTVGDDTPYYVIYLTNFILPDGDVNFIKGPAYTGDDGFDTRIEAENCRADNLMLPDIGYVSLKGTFGTVRASGLEHLNSLWVRTAENVIVESCNNLVNLQLYSNEAVTTGNSVDIRDCSNLKTICGYKSGYKDLRIQNAPSVKQLEWYSSSLTRIDIDDIPTNAEVNIKDNKSLTAQMPAWLDNFVKAGERPGYDVRFEYSYPNDGKYTTEKGTKFNYTDNGYGFYYAGEPAQGYHRDPR